jgi:hypothetical protein
VIVRAVPRLRKESRHGRESAERCLPMARRTICLSDGKSRTVYT